MTRAELIEAWQEATALGDEAHELYARLMDIIAAELLGGGEVPLESVGTLIHGKLGKDNGIILLFDKDFGESFDEYY